LLDVFTQNCSLPEPILSLIYQNFSKIIEKVSDLVKFFNFEAFYQNFDFFDLLFHIIEGIDEEDIPKRKDQVLLYTELLFFLGDKLMQGKLDDFWDPQACSYFVQMYYRGLLEKLENHMPILDPYFDKFLSYFLIIHSEFEKNEQQLELLNLIAKFDNFLEKVANYIISEREKKLEAATFLNEYISVNLERIDKERLNLIQSLFSTCPDALIKDALTIFISHKEF
jgi:hypothetical protein